RNWSATVVHFAHEIPLRTGLNVATKAVSSKPVDHFGKSPFSDFRSILGNVELKELPVMRYRVKALVPLHHGLGGNQLDDGARWIRTARRRIGDCQRRVEISQQVVNVELTHVCHLPNAAK